MIGLGFAIIGIIAFGAIVTAAILAGGGYMRNLNEKGKVEHLQDAIKVDELEHRRKALAFAHEQEMTKILSAKQLPVGSEENEEEKEEEVKVKRRKVEEPYLTHEEYKAEQRHQEQASRAQDAELVDE